jgi:hypothetical protein
MTADAEMYAAEDRRRRDETEARNHAVALAAATEESLAGSSGNMPDDVAAELRSAVVNLKEALGGTNVADAIRAAAEEVGQASQKMQITIFAQTQRWMDRKQPEAAAGMAVGSVEVWPRSFSQWSNDPAGHAEQSWQLICRICGDRWDRNPDSLPTGLETLRGPYASTQEAEKAGTSHLRDRHYGEIPNLRPRERFAAHLFDGRLSEGAMQCRSCLPDLRPSSLWCIASMHRVAEDSDQQRANSRCDRCAYGFAVARMRFLIAFSRSSISPEVGEPGSEPHGSDRYGLRIAIR